MLLLTMLLMPAADPPGERERLVAGARTVLAGLRRAAADNAAAASPLRGDALTAYYVRAAARTAADLPRGDSGRAFLLGLGVGLDPSGLMRGNLLVGATWRRIESDEERRDRLRLLGTPTMHDRGDLGQHFAVSAALTVLLGEKGAESTGVVKELLDARAGGSGFSFADLAANLSGIALARQVLAAPDRLAALARSFRVIDYCLPPRGLPERLTTADFERRFGGIGDARYRRQRDELVERIGQLPGLRPRP